MQDIAYFLFLLFGDPDLEHEWYCIFGALIFLVCGILFFISDRKEKKSKIYGRIIVTLISVFIYMPLINDDIIKIGIGLISHTPVTSLDGFFIIVSMMALWTVFLIICGIMKIIRHTKKDR